MRYPMCLGAALVLGLGAGPGLRAAEGEGPSAFSYGVRAYLVQPYQDLRDLDSRQGFGGGVFVENQASEKLWIQSRFDYVKYPQTNQPNLMTLGAALTVPAPLTLAVDSASVGFDLHYYPEISFLGAAVRDRFFVMAGAMAVRYEFMSSGATQPPDAPVSGNGIYRTKDRTPVKLGWALGAGVDLTDWLDLTVRYTTVNIEGTTFSAVETGLGIRF